MTTDEKIATLLAGEMKITGRDFVVRLAELRQKGLGLWAKELEFLDHLLHVQSDSTETTHV